METTELHARMGDNKLEGPGEGLSWGGGVWKKTKVKTPIIMFVVGCGVVTRKVSKRQKLLWAGACDDRKGGTHG